MSFLKLIYLSEFQIFLKSVSCIDPKVKTFGSGIMVHGAKKPSVFTYGVFQG